MPKFQITIEHDVEFEVFCGTCGAGLCRQSDTRISRHRAENQVTVEACERCLENARDEVREELQSKIDQLEQIVSDPQETNNGTRL